MVKPQAPERSVSSCMMKTVIYVTFIKCFKCSQLFQIKSDIQRMKFKETVFFLQLRLQKEKTAESLC